MLVPSQRPLPDDTQHSQETDLYATGRILNRNRGKRAAADPRLRLRGIQDRPDQLLVTKHNVYTSCIPSGKQIIFIAAYHLIRGMFLFEEVVHCFSAACITGHTVDCSYQNTVELGYNVIRGILCRYKRGLF